MKLYTYFRSSAAYRVRIALQLKGLAYDAIPVHLLRDGGEQNHSSYQAVNPQGLVPALDTGSAVLTQSLAILEWLEETYPQPPLLPQGADARAAVRAIAQAIACDVHPLNNLRVLNYLTHTLGVTEAQKNAWYLHWVNTGLAAVEQMLVAAGSSGAFCIGDSPTFADCCLIPQVFNARRFACDLSAMPTIVRIADACEQLPAFVAAAPAQQSDAV